MVLAQITDRFSVRSFSDKQVEQNKINEVLEAGRLAPSWVNVQPWHFIAVKNSQTKDLLCKLSHQQPHVGQAPVIIACCGDKRAFEFDNYKKILESRPGITQQRVNTLLNSPAYNPSLIGDEAVTYRTLEELTFAVAYMTLEAHNQGLGACIVGGIGNELTQANPDIYAVVKEELGLPEDVMLCTLLLLGYPSEDIQKLPKSRKPKDQVNSYEKYGQNQ